MTKENKFKIGLCLQGIALSMDEITLKANEDRLKIIEDIVIAEPTGDEKALKQKPKSGHWKIIPSNNNGEYRPNKYACSECGWTIDLCRGLQQDTGHRLFCEHCGAKMESEES